MLKILLAITLVTSIGFADSRASGTLMIDKKVYRISNAKAMFQPDPFVPTKKDVVLLLTDQEVASDRFDVGPLNANAAVGMLHGIVVTIDEAQQPYDLILLGVTHVTGTSVCGFDAKRYDAQLVSGHIYMDASEEADGHTYKFDVQFSASLADNMLTLESGNDDSAGAPLPADGGEPGRAYMEFDQAIRTGNVENLKKYGPESADTALLDMEQAKQVLQMMQVTRPNSIKILRGFSTGQTATLYVEGKDPMFGKMGSATVSMVKLDNVWRVNKEDWKMDADKGKKK
jgi:hypothetical protein